MLIWSIIVGFSLLFFFLTETVMGCLYSSWPECRKSDYIDDFFVLLHLAAKNEGATKAFRFPP